MPPIQRYLIVGLSSLYWFLAIGSVLLLYSWMAASKASLLDVLLRATLAGGVGALYGLLCALTSYAKPISGNWFQRAAIGGALGLLIALLSNLSSNYWTPTAALKEYAIVIASYPAAMILCSLFGLTTPRRIFFAIAK